MIDKKEILSRLDYTALYSELIPRFKIIKPGAALGCCPFHDDHNPSLSMDLNTGAYFCHSCGAGRRGSGYSGTFDLCMKVWGLSFRETIEKLSERAGVRL